MPDVLLFTRETTWALDLLGPLEEAGLSADYRDPANGLKGHPAQAYSLILADPDPGAVDQVAEALRDVPPQEIPRVGILGDWVIGLPLLVSVAIVPSQSHAALVGAIGRTVGAAELHRKTLRASELRMDELAGELKRYSALQAVTARMSATLVLSESLRTFVEGVREALNLSAIATLLVDEHSGEMRVVAESPLGAERDGLLDTAVACLSRAGQSSPGPPPFSCIWPRDGVVAVPIHTRKKSVGAIVAVARFGDRNTAFCDRLVTLVGGVSAHVANAVRNASLYLEVQTKSAQMSVLYDVGRTITSVHEVQDLLDVICDRAMVVTGARRCSLMLLDEAEGPLRIRAARGMPDWVKNSAVEEVGEGVGGYVVESGMPLLIDDITKDPRFQSRVDSRYFGVTSLLSVPLVVHGAPMGVLNLTDKESDCPFGQTDLELAMLLASQAAIAIDNAFLYDHLRTLAATDSLTRLYNHHHFMTHLNAAINAARRHGHPLSVLMLDLDHFKAVNDTFGHQQGDRVLQAAAAVLQRTAREEDVLARYGGEEFAAALPATDIEGALRLAERLRARVSRLEFTRGSDILTVTVSIGAAELDNSVQTAEELADRADIALYRAKQTGRNRVCAYDGSLSAIEVLAHQGQWPEPANGIVIIAPTKSA